MKRNIFKQRLLLEGWLVVDRIPLCEATDMELKIFERLELPLKESLIFFTRVSKTVQTGKYLGQLGNFTSLRVLRMTQELLTITGTILTCFQQSYLGITQNDLGFTENTQDLLRNLLRNYFISKFSYYYTLFFQQNNSIIMRITPLLYVLFYY